MLAFPLARRAIVRWILPLRMPLAGRTLTGFGFELCV